MVAATGVAKGRTCARTVALDALAGALESPAAQHDSCVIAVWTGAP